VGFHRRIAETKTENPRPERRKNRRFSVRMKLTYRLQSGQSGIGELLNISTAGWLIRTSSLLPKGELVEVDLAWPAYNDRGHRMELAVHGFIMRSDSAGTAVAISKSEFRRVPDNCV
jgi:hypothetical protein